MLGPQDPEVSTAGSLTELSLAGDTDLDQRVAQRQVFSPLSSPSDPVSLVDILSILLTEPRTRCYPDSSRPLLPRGQDSLLLYLQNRTWCLSPLFIITLSSNHPHLQPGLLPWLPISPSSTAPTRSQREPESDHRGSLGQITTLPAGDLPVASPLSGKASKAP